MAEPPLVVRLRRLGRLTGFVSVLLGGMFVVMARRTGNTSTIASALFWGAAVLQFALALLLLRRAPKA